MRLVEAQQGDTLWAKDFDRDAAEVRLQREIAEAVAASLALKWGLATAPMAKSGDAEFLRRYLAARTRSCAITGFPAQCRPQGDGAACD